MERSDFPYTQYFCEENIYLLAKQLLERTELKVDVIFISSLSKKTPIWKQVLSIGDNPVIWDYHVICCVKGLNEDERRVVIDFDSTCGFVTDAEAYIEQSYRPELSLSPPHQQLFRIVPAKDFVDHFASDRSHMNPDHTRFPDWPCIRGSLADSEMNLQSYFEMGSSLNDRSDLGVVLTLSEFCNFIKSS